MVLLCVCYLTLTIYLANFKKISFYKIAKSTGITSGNLSDIIHFRKKQENLSILTIKKLADFFKISIDDLVNKDLSLENKQ